MIDAKMLRDQCVVALKLADLAGKYAASGIEDHYFIGHVERELEILFDQDRRLLFLLEALDRAANIRASALAVG